VVERIDPPAAAALSLEVEIEIHFQNGFCGVKTFGPREIPRRAGESERLRKGAVGVLETL
jgi:hypothetical protein